jgi:hypothetical protein
MEKQLKSGLRLAQASSSEMKQAPSPMYSGMVWSGVYRVMLMATYPHSSAAQVPGDGQLALRVQTDLKLIIR